MLSERFINIVEIVLYIAVNSASHPINTIELSKHKKSSRRAFENLLQSLVKEEVLKSITGPKGGYVIATEKRKISLLDLWNISNKFYKTSNIDNKLQQVMYANVIFPLQQSVKDTLATITIADLVLKLENSQNKKSCEFTI